MYSHIIVFKLHFILLLLINSVPANRHPYVYLNCSQFIPPPLRQNGSPAALSGVDATFATVASNETSIEELSTEAAKALSVPFGAGAGAVDGTSNRTRAESYKSSESESTDPRLAPALYECFRAHRYNPMFFPVPPDRPFAPIGSLVGFGVLSLISFPPFKTQWFEDVKTLPGLNCLINYYYYILLKIILF